MKKFLNYKFLMTLLASVVVLLEVLMRVFKINLNIEAVISVFVAIIGIMVTIGVVSKDKTDKEVKSREDLQEYLDENNNGAEIQEKKDNKTIDESKKNVETDD
ncbi:MAG: hypothetical protein ACI4TI_03985 [Christensenellales bacterium]